MVHWHDRRTITKLVDQGSGCQAKGASISGVELVAAIPRAQGRLVTILLFQSISWGKQQPTENDASTRLSEFQVPSLLLSP